MPPPEHMNTGNEWNVYIHDIGSGNKIKVFEPKGKENTINSDTQVQWNLYALETQTGDRVIALVPKESEFHTYAQANGFVGSRKLTRHMTLSEAKQMNVELQNLVEQELTKMNLRQSSTIDQTIPKGINQEK